MSLPSSSPYLEFLLSSINRNTSEGTNLVATDIKQYLCRFFCLKTQNVFSDFCTSSVLLRHNIKRSNIANIKKKKTGTYWEGALCGLDAFTVRKSQAVLRQETARRPQLFNTELTSLHTKPARGPAVLGLPKRPR